MNSLGIIETIGLAAAIQAADAACKAANVNCIGYRTVGSGRVNICFVGEISAIRTAIEYGISVVKSEQRLASLIIARPEQSVVAALQTLKGRGFYLTHKPAVFKAAVMPEITRSDENKEQKVSIKKGQKS